MDSPTQPKETNRMSTYNYTWTITSDYHYDATLTQELVNNWIADQ